MNMFQTLWPTALKTDRKKICFKVSKLTSEFQGNFEMDVSPPWTGDASWQLVLLNWWCADGMTTASTHQPGPCFWTCSTWCKAFWENSSDMPSCRADSARSVFYLAQPGWGQMRKRSYKQSGEVDFTSEHAYLLETHKKSACAHEHRRTLSVFPKTTNTYVTQPLL